MPDYIPTNAASSGVKLDKKTLKSIALRDDRPGLIYLARWGGFLAVTSMIVWLSLGTLWVWPAMFLHGIFLAVPSYSFSHEAAHGTAFRTRWLNECVLWFTSLLYMEEPLHRRYTHTNHHTFTWHAGKDSQMPFDTPMGFGDWLAEISGSALLRFHLDAIMQLALGRYSDVIREVAPQSEHPKMTRNARAFVLIYAAIAGLLIAGYSWPLWFLVLPRILGAPVMLLFTLVQHVELQENSPSILESTRSFSTAWLGRFLYMNMNNHVEHHLYPQVPFYGLPTLADAVRNQVPAPDRGLFRTNWEVLLVVFRRSRGLSTKAPTLRQAPHMITDGGPVERFSQRTM